MGSKKNFMGHHNPKKANKRTFFWWRSGKSRMLIIATIIVVTFTTYYRNNMPYFTESTQEENKYEQRATAAKIDTKTEPKSVHNHCQTQSKSPTDPSTSPVPKVTLDLPSLLFPRAVDHCKMFSCFNYSRCNITGRFPIYLYNLEIPNPENNRLTLTRHHLRKMLSANHLITTNHKAACIYVALVGEYKYSKSNESKISHNFSNVSIIKKLKYWRRAGRNHVLINLAQTGFLEDSGEAILAQTTFSQNQFRPGFDVVIPPVFGPISGDVWSMISPISRPKRRFLLSFQGLRSAEMKSNLTLETLVQFLYKMRKRPQKPPPTERFFIQFQCDSVDKKFDLSIRDWAMCENRDSRRILLKKSTFVLIIAPADTSYVSTYLLQTRLFEALQCGAIPVILGGDRVHLPYEEVLDWRKAVISLSIYRVTELHFFLSTISDEDILAFRSQGRMLWERYLGSLQSVLDSLLGAIRYRLNIPAQPISSVLNSVFEYEYTNMTKNYWRRPSKSFQRNFTVGLLNGYEQWNVWGDPFALYPHLPWDPIMFPKARFVDTSVASRFHESCKDLAGDHPVEEYTMIILTYKRSTMLSLTLNAFSKMPYLNKIIVVNNEPSKPSTADWPKSGAPIVLVWGMGNSLNNRFLPYHLIETEAVFCVDDDAVSIKKDIYFAFKTWREHRDQIVGFCGRNYEWYDGFVYNTIYKSVHKHPKAAHDNPSKVQLCEASMVLTGAAFIHRYFLWAYWRILPQAIRDFVDKNMNCEDIAMNFLVSYITRKPPVVVSFSNKSNITNGPYKKLSGDKSHYDIRNKCMQFFTKVMGYNPLLTTHYRVTSFRRMPLEDQI